MKAMLSPKQRKQETITSAGWIAIGSCAGLIIGAWLWLSGFFDALVNLGASLLPALPGLTVIVGLALLYLLPSLIAWKSPRIAAIGVANLVFGWTIVGWFIVLIWALAENGSMNNKPNQSV
jgi:hypothetical protein